MSREIDQCNAFLNLCASLFRSHFLVSTYRRVQFVLFANNSSVVALQEFLFCFVFPQFAAVLARSLFNRSFFVCFSCCLLLPEKRKEGFSCVCLCVFVEVMAGCGGVLLVTDVAMLPASVVLWAVQTFGDKAAGGKAMAVVTNASHLAPDRHLGLATASLEVVISLVENPGHHTKAWLSEIVHVLRPGGVLWLQEPFACQDVAEADQQRLGDAPVQTQAVLERNLLLAGFVDIETAECVSGVGLAESYSTSATGSEHGPLLKPVAVRVLKPTWETGSSFGIKKKATLEQESTLVSLGDTLRLSSEDVNDTSLPLANTWKATSVDDDGDEFVDEDALLDEDDLKRPVLPGADDCEVEKAGKKACKNCTCGRAELEEKTPLTAAQLNNPQSACGNCGLGDAFRCGGCPYRGLPAFKLGEKISLPGSLLVADA